MTDERLRSLRAEIDALDAAVLDHLARRRACVRQLFALKDATGLPRLDAERERALLADRRAAAEALGLPPELAESVFRAVLASSHALP
jgi:chorismate mutase-like protein